MTSVTIRDVARAAGVGVATVSRVINGSPNVREDTRLRVLQTIDMLNYVPNVAARQLSGGKTLVIGVVTPYLTMPSFSERLAGIQTVLWDSKYDIVLHSVRNPDDLAGKLRTLFTQKRVDGIILLTPPHLDDGLWKIAPEMPVIVVDSLHLVDRYPTLVIDDVTGGRLAVEYLVREGHRDIAFIGDDLESIFGVTSNKYRFDGFQEALRVNNIPERPDWYSLGPLGSETAQQQAHEILGQSERPTAIFATSDIKAFNVISVAQTMGLRVPDDLAVIGFDDIEAARYMNLTTIRQYLRYTGERAAQLLLSWLQDEVMPEPRTRLCQVDVVERGTV